MLRSIILFALFLNFGVTRSQDMVTLSGYVRDANTGESLIGANIINLDNQQEGTSSNAYGFYSLSLSQGEYKIGVSYLGYSDQEEYIQLDSDLSMDFLMNEGFVIQEVVVTAKSEEKDKNVRSTQMGVIELPVENIKKLPAIFGEVDVLKAIQLLPGVLSSGEGSAGFYVRGGGPDQNLVLLDEAVVYNTGHLLGFFSVFNSDAIKSTNLIKGGMPANYGGRLSSVLDVSMKDGNNKYYQVEGGVGLVSSRLTVQGPIEKDKSSFIISSRRTYLLDLAQPGINNTDFAGTNYFFYDLNAKLNFTLSKKDRLYLSSYFGRDVFKFRQDKRDFYFNLPYGNATATLRWNHLFNNKLFMNLSAIYNDYDLSFEGGQEDFVFDLFSGIRDYTLKTDFDFFPNTRHSVKFGANYTYHKLTPNIISANNGEVDFDSNLTPKYSQESAFYILDDFKWSNKLSLNYGLRLALYSQYGPYTSKLTGEEFNKFESVVNYHGLEPRLAIKYGLSNSSSLKLGLTKTNQFIHLASNSTSTLPTDIWVPSTEIVKPQEAIQLALGYFKNFNNNNYEGSIELYYKDLKNQIDYADDGVQMFGTDEEDAFVFGKGRAYGMELFLRKSRGDLTGWIGYTLSRSERSFDDIENGRFYPTVYDRSHDISVVANYRFGPKWEMGGVFVYGTGRNYTPYKSFYFIEDALVPEYGPRNSQRLPTYHRMDLSLTWTPKGNTQRKYKSSWTFSVYNGYNRQNPFFIYFDAETDQETESTQLKAYQVTIFPIIPSVTYNFKWNQKVESK